MVDKPRKGEVHDTESTTST